MNERPQREVLLRTVSFDKAQRVAEAIHDARRSRPKPGLEYGYPVVKYTCWRTFPKFWTAYRGVWGWLRGPWEKHWLVPPWTVEIIRWPDYEGYAPFVGGKKSVSREAWAAFVERAKRPWRYE